MIQVLDEAFVMNDSAIFGAEELNAAAAINPGRRPPRILLAEDDVEMRRYLAQAFRKARFEVVEAEHGARVLDYIVETVVAGTGLDVDAVVSDIRMPGADGLCLLSALRSHRRDLPVVLITAFGNPETHEESRLRGARAVIDKPFEFDELLAVVRAALATGGPADAQSQSE